MKRISLLLVFLMTIMSCEKATEVDFSTSLSATSDQISVNNVPMRGMVAGQYETTFVLNLDNNDTHKYLDNIKNLDLNEVSLVFQGLSGLAGNQTPTHLKLTFNNQINLEYTDFIYDHVASGQKFQINQSQKIREIAQLLLDRKQLTIKLEGNIPDSATYNFFIKFMAKAKITANAL